ncbi:MAG: hypothetical protein ABJA74_12360 [Lapillicoccus sp.]
MPDWLWVVAAVGLGVIIYLLLRGRTLRGRHRVPVVEYVPGDDKLLSGLPGPGTDAIAVEGEPGRPEHGELAEEGQRVEDERVEGRRGEVIADNDADDDADEPTPEQQEREERAWAHGEAGEDAELRHDDGYVETFGNDRTDNSGNAEAAGDAPPVEHEHPHRHESAAGAEEHRHEHGHDGSTEEPDHDGDHDASGGAYESPAAPAADEPDEPPPDEPPPDEPPPDEPVVQEPAVQEPAVEEPATEEPATEVRESHYGAGSALPGPGGSGPQGWSVKGNSDSMLFYTADALGFGRSAVDVWFESEEAASAAGFTRWDAHHR